MTNRPDGLDQLVRPAPETLIETVAAATERSENRFGAVFESNNISVKDAFFHIGGEEIALDLIPLAGVDPTDYTKIILDPSKVKERVVRQTKPFESFLGTIKGAGSIIPHKDFIETLSKVAVRDGKPIAPKAIVISRDGKQIAVQFPLDPFEVKGDPIHQNVLIFSNVIRSAGAGVMLWDMALRCINQIPVVRMGKTAGQKGDMVVTGGGRHGLRIERMLADMGDFVFNAQNRVREAYTKMATAPVDEQMIELVLSKIYSVPDFPRPKVNDTPEEKFKVMNAWSEKYNAAVNDRNIVREIFENGNGTHGTAAVNGTVYGLFQAITELETKRPYTNPTSPFNQFVAGTGRGQRSASAFDICYEYAYRYSKAKNTSLPIREMAR